MTRLVRVCWCVSVGGPWHCCEPYNCFILGPAGTHLPLLFKWKTKHFYINCWWMKSVTSPSSIWAWNQKITVKPRQGFFSPSHMPQDWISKHVGYTVMARFSLVLNLLTVKYGTAFNKAQHLTGMQCFENFGEIWLCSSACCRTLCSLWEQRASKNPSCGSSSTKALRVKWK